MDYYNIAYLCTFIGIIITASAQLFIQLEYSIYRRKNNSKGISGKNAARVVLDKNGLENVSIESVAGTLTDHYDPTTKTIRLSKYNYDGTSIAAVAVACHECGHAIQDKSDYGPLRLRHNMIPFVNISSHLGYIAIAIGLLLSWMGLIWIGIALEGVILAFQLVTLPVEFDASNRALKQIKELDILDKKEHRKAKKVLIAAALTYVASVASTILQILRLILIYGNKRNKR